MNLDESTVVVVVVSLFAALWLSSSVVAGVAGSPTDGFDSHQAQDQGPELDSGERLNDTAVRLVFVDDAGVVSESINASDFLLSAGSIADISVETVETNAQVTVLLSGPVNADQLTVGVRNGTEISDVDGNTIDTGGFVGVTIDGMDSVAPSVRRMTVPEQVSDEAEIRLVFDEAVESFRARLSGTRSAEFEKADFERVRTGQYVLQYEPPADGAYTFELVSATDTAGNTGAFALAASMEVQTRTVSAVAGIDLSASSGLNLTFDASRSADAIEYVWDFGDGATAAGQRVTHEFRPGNYTVGLRVIDEFGNVGRDTIELNLSADGTAGLFESGGGDNQSRVTVDSSGGNRPTDTQVVVSAMDPGTPFVVRGTEEDAALVGTADFTLDELAVTPEESGGFGLGLSAVGVESETLTAARSATGASPVGGFVARPTVAPDALSSVTVEFSVDTDRLDSIGASPTDVSLYRESNSNWTAHPTAIESSSGDRISFESAVPGFSRFAVLAGGDEDSGETTDPVDDEDPGESGDTNESSADENKGQSDEDPSTDTGNETTVSQDQFQVTNVTLSDESVDTGQEFIVEAVVQNQGEQPADYVAALEVDGEVVTTKDVLRIPPGGETLPVSFRHSINESGTVAVSVNGTGATDLSVGGGGGGGGGLFGFLGFLPLGLIRTFLMFVVAPLAVLVVVLKGAATYLGY